MCAYAIARFVNLYNAYTEVFVDGIGLKLRPSTFRY